MSGQLRHAEAETGIFATALEHYLIAKAPKDAFEVGIWNPAHDAGILTPEIENEMERLDEIFSAAEDRLLKTRSPDAAAFCFKYMIVNREGRDLDAYDDILLAEARQFSAHLAKGSALS